jgi:hypothetical protein
LIRKSQRKILLGIDVRIILKRTLGRYRCEEKEWIKLTQDRVQWCAFVNMVVNVHVPKKQGIS